MQKQSLTWSVGQECAHLEKRWLPEHTACAQKGESPLMPQAGPKPGVLMTWPLGRAQSGLTSLAVCDEWGGGMVKVRVLGSWWSDNQNGPLFRYMKG